MGTKRYIKSNRIKSNNNQTLCVKLCVFFRGKKTKKTRGTECKTPEIKKRTAEEAMNTTQPDKCSMPFSTVIFHHYINILVRLGTAA
jgi:hypothetical protein